MADSVIAQDRPLTQRTRHNRQMISTTCGHCERLSHFTNRWGQTDGSAETAQLASTCDNCGMLTIFWARGLKSVGTTIDATSAAHSLRNAVDAEWAPRVGYAPSVDDVPDHIARAAREAHASASVGNHMAAILMARTVVEATAKAKGITTGNLAGKINELSAQQFIRPAIAEQAHEVRFAGNDMAHGDIDVAPTAIDAEEILALMSEVLQEVFQGPARLERIRAKRQAAH